ncbi:MAG: methionyl-tRNA formyltransferase [Lachnobacterium sp.]|nr:methionyl-tRNA formyltransferase [Lachnobacterium sp.]
MRVVFMGTPDFAVPCLEKIIEKGHEVALVVTQPDKPKGRGKNLCYPSVKECALAHNIEVFQPRRVKETECVEYIAKYSPDIIVVAAFGQILPKSILDMPKYCCINVHASLLPKYRGAAPIQWAVINGDEVSGVTIMKMGEGLDTGDIITKREIRLAEDETGGSLFDKLANVGADLLIETMDIIEDGKAVFTPQDNEAATHTSMIKKDLGNIDWSKSAVEIERLIRGLNPWPSAYTLLDQKTFKIWKAQVEESVNEYEPGCIVEVTKDTIKVQTGDGVLALQEVQLQGKKRMDTASFLRGYDVKEGTFLKMI